MPDFKTIADFRRDNGRAIHKVCARFVMLCRRMNLFTEAMVAIDGSKWVSPGFKDALLRPRSAFQTLPD